MSWIQNNIEYGGGNKMTGNCLTQNPAMKNTEIQTEENITTMPKIPEKIRDNKIIFILTICTLLATIMADSLFDRVVRGIGLICCGALIIITNQKINNQKNKG